MPSSCIAHGLSWRWSYGSRICCLIIPLTPFNSLLLTHILYVYHVNYYYTCISCFPMVCNATTTYRLMTPLTLLSGVRVTRSLVLCVCLVDRCFCFSTFFLLNIVLSVLLRYRDYDYPFGIFKLLQSQVYLCPVDNLTELHVHEQFEDSKGVIYSRTSMKHRHMCMVHVHHFLTPE